jgi:hypothetical protein
MTRVVVSLSTNKLLRNRLSRASVEPQTAQSQAIIGTPPLVPVPKKVNVKGGTNMHQD